MENSISTLLQPETLGRRPAAFTQRPARSCGELTPALPRGCDRDSCALSQILKCQMSGVEGTPSEWPWREVSGTEATHGHEYLGTWRKSTSFINPTLPPGRPALGQRHRSRAGRQLASTLSFPRPHPKGEHPFP